MPLGAEVGLVAGDIVLDGDPAAHGKGMAPPHFGTSVVAKRSPISTAELLLPVIVFVQ